MKILLIILLFPILSFGQTKTVVSAKSQKELAPYVVSVFDSAIAWGYLTVNDSIITYRLTGVPKRDFEEVITCVACDPDSVYGYFVFQNDTNVIPTDTSKLQDKYCFEVLDTVFQKKYNKDNAVTFQIWPDIYFIEDSIYKK